jgi:uncharacterized membrane protein (DUF4010 family)
MHPLLLSLIASAGLGALIGLVRQWSEQLEKPHGVEYSGVRTFTFWCVLGCVAAFLSARYSTAVLPVVVAIIGIHYVTQIRLTESGGAGGSTTFAASLLTVLVGALVYWQHHQEAVFISATTGVLLGLKARIHAWTRAFNSADIHATLQFIAITGVILPLVPDRDLGPFNAFNPFSTWLMVVLISGLGFAGYVAMRMLGTSAGILLTSLLGGLASSTASTLAFSRQSHEDPGLSRAYAMAVVAACSVMLPRVLIIVSVLNRELALQLILPFAVMLIPAAGFGVWLWFSRRPEGSEAKGPALSNPLNLLTAVKFALLYAGIAILVKGAASFEVLQTSLLPISFVSGLTDVDAISLSVAGNQGSGTIAMGLATKAIIVAIAANSLLKAGLTQALGSKAFRLPAGIVLALTAVAGIAALWLVV